MDETIDHDRERARAAALAASKAEFERLVEDERARLRLDPPRRRVPLGIPLGIPLDVAPAGSVDGDGSPPRPRP